MFVSQIYDEAAEILATTDQRKVFRKLNQAVQTLMESGHYFHTNQEVDVCTGWDGMTITLPRGIEVPLGVNVDGSPMYFRGRLFQYHVNKGGMYNPVSWAWDDRGFVATVMDIRQPSQLVAISEHSADAGGQIRVVGTDANNRELRTQMPDGTTIDGILVPIHAQTDFPLGSIEPDGVTIQTRDVAVSPLTKFLSTAAHQLQSGQSGVLSLGSGTMPSFIYAGQTYYIGVDDNFTIQLYQNPLDAKAGTNPVYLKSVLNAGTITLTDARPSNLLTAINLQSTPTITIDSPNELTFSVGSGAGFSTALPSPLVSGATYFGQPLDATNIQVYSSIVDAQNGTNPVLLTGNSGKFNTDIRKVIAPQTTLSFAVQHYYLNGDQVQAFTSGGTLPTPLIAGQNYFVNVINTTTISLHQSQADALASTATSLVNPIVLTDNGTGTNSLVKLLPATSVTGTTSQITAAGLNLSAPAGAGAQYQAVVVGSVVSTTITNGGTKYISAPAITFSDPPAPPAGTDQTVSTATGYAVMIPDGVGSTTYAVGSIVITSSGLGYTTAPSITIANPAGYGGGGAVIGAVTVTSGAVTNIAVTNGGTGYTSSPVVVITGGGGNGALATANISAGVITSITINAGGTGYTSSPSVSVQAGTRAVASATIQTSFVSSFTQISSGSGYTQPPQVKITGGGGSGATATATIDGSGNVTAVNIVTEGTGYTSIPTVTIKPSTGVFVEFSSTGTLPAPLVAGTAYRAEAPLNGSTGNFTVVGSDFTPITITSSSTGNFYVALTRPFSISFNKNWSGDFSGISTGQGVYLASDYLLPTGVNNTTLYYMRVIDSTTAQLYDTLAHANGSPSTTGIIGVTALGVGQGYYAIRIASYAKAYNNLVVPSSIEYLANGELVKFSSTGSLPYPLVAGTDYKITLSGNNVSLTDTSNNPIVFVNGGVPTLPVGQMSMNIVRSFTPVASTSIDAVGSLFEIGDKVTVRPSAGDTLPTGLVASSMASSQYYYTRPVDANSFELYDTYGNATNTSSTIGRITFYDTGNSVSSTFFVDSILPPTLVKSVLHVEKPETLGYVSLYALDYGRSNDMALIGQYHPTETNPKYRRIRIGQQCSWARIIYRMAHPDITSKYDYIPLENERAIIAAVHACDLEDKDFADQAQRYWGIAIGYLRNQNESMEGHAMMPPQINNITYGDGTDPNLEGCYGAFM